MSDPAGPARLWISPVLVAGWMVGQGRTRAHRVDWRWSRLQRRLGGSAG